MGQGRVEIIVNEGPHGVALRSISVGQHGEIIVPQRYALIGQAESAGRHDGLRRIQGRQVFISLHERIPKQDQSHLSFLLFPALFVLFFLFFVICFSICLRRSMAVTQRTQRRSETGRRHRPHQLPLPLFPRQGKAHRAINTAYIQTRFAVTLPRRQAQRRLHILP